MEGRFSPGKSKHHTRNQIGGRCLSLLRGIICFYQHGKEGEEERSTTTFYLLSKLTPPPPRSFSVSPLVVSNQWFAHWGLLSCDSHNHLIAWTILSRESVTVAVQNTHPHPNNIVFKVNFSVHSKIRWTSLVKRLWSAIKASLLYISNQYRQAV